MARWEPDSLNDIELVDSDHQSTVSKSSTLLIIYFAPQHNKRGSGLNIGNAGHSNRRYQMGRLLHCTNLPSLANLALCPSHRVWEPNNGIGSSPCNRCISGLRFWQDGTQIL